MVKIKNLKAVKYYIEDDYSPNPNKTNVKKNLLVSINTQKDISLVKRFKINY